MLLASLPFCRSANATSLIAVLLQVTWFERLSSYHGHQTRTNTDKVYGDGFRAALEAFQQYGLRNVLLHVKKHHFLPSVDIAAEFSKGSIKNALRLAE